MSSIGTVNRASDEKDDPTHMKVIPKQVRGVGFGVPYVETFPQQKMRELWESCDFNFANGILFDTINSPDEHDEETRPLLCMMQTTTTEKSSSEPSSGYEYMFDPLYDGHYQFEYPPHTAKDVNDSLKCFCLRVAYQGSAFCGWQTQKGYDKQPSVQKTLENYLDPLFVTVKANEKRNKSANLPVAGRTDAGVHAIGQICRFRTHHQNLTARDIQQYLSKKISEGPSASVLKVTDVVEVNRAFHPTFTTSSRAYVYLIDVQSTGFWSLNDHLDEKVSYLNKLLMQVEGKELNYFGLSYGKPQTQDFLCTLHHARARLVRRPETSSSGYVDTAIADQNAVDTAICIELVGSRFLRRMVRLLVQATMSVVAQEWSNKEKDHISDVAFLENHLDMPEDAFLNQVLQCDRSLVSRVAPPHGLLFVGARLLAI
ncbi:tRNA pseudouridine synthase A [Nitzschia inconspicua]|uniref:tRNA pseudouridine synthase A n=1 Tax=Nitzschia inconspicua TaxID=303405 RepID=A0A9K3LPP3_9STRA|nr:tRNA pseudouridine synthase A [Nitzschia inconspicua]